MALTPDNFVDLRDGRFDSTSRAQLDAAFNKFLAGTTRDNLAVHFHGGLVKEQDGMGIAERLTAEYSSASAYPLFFVWESGLLEAIRDGIGNVSKEGFFQRALDKILQFAVGKLTQQPATRGLSVEVPDILDVRGELAKAEAGGSPYGDLRILPPTELSATEAQQFADHLEADPAFMTEVQKITNAVAAAPAGTRGAGVAGVSITRMSPRVLEQIREDATAAAAPGAARGLFSTARLVKGAVVILARIISRFIKKRDHGLHATVVEEIFREFYVSAVGQEIWGQMKRDTADAFGANGQIFGGTAFLEKLRDADAAGKRPRVTLIGHSAGSIYICNLLNNVGNLLPADYQFDLVFMAPAVTTELFVETLQKASSRIRNIRMFTMHDKLELENELIRVVYPHSLLYFISGMLEEESDKPVLGMERYFLGNAPFYTDPASGIPAAHNFFTTGGPKRLALSISTGTPGMETDSVTHGGFDDSDAGVPHKTIDSVKFILKNGF